jgi:DNA-binding GntR family transcriptional regulator
VKILEAIEHRNSDLAVERMRAHLEGVREVLLRWESDSVPLREVS